MKSYLPEFSMRDQQGCSLDTQVLLGEHRRRDRCYQDFRYVNKPGDAPTGGMT